MAIDDLHIANPTIWTIGHSVHTADALVSLLQVHSIDILVDVRRFPGSRRFPHFHTDSLATTLTAHDIGYRWIEPLGGRRRTSSNSSNSAWRNASFRAYANYIATEPFADGLFELTMLACGARVAIMCAEVLWWRCHRRLIADVLVSLGMRVEHILGDGNIAIHQIAPPAKIVNGALSYEED